jgi:putative transposase
MKRSRFSEEQMIAILKEQEAVMATEEVCRRHGISSATFYKWKGKFGGLEVSAERRRFGYRRLHWLLSREGMHMNHRKFRRLYREERLQVRRRSSRKRALGTRRPLEQPQAVNQRWSLDFVSDAFSCGRRFRIFAVVDDHSRERVRLIADTSISGARVARELDMMILERLAKPQQNGFIESFNARLRDEWLNETLFSSLAHAREVLAAWRHDYSHHRPNSSLGNMTPVEMVAKSNGAPGWGLTPNPVVAITPNHGHQNGQRLYS